MRGARRAPPAWPEILAGRRRQPGSGTEVSQRYGPARPESRRPALRGAWQERNGTSVERGEPPAWDFQKHQVCNLAAACYTPCPSCPCSRHLQVRGVRPQSSPPRARPAQKHKQGVRGAPQPPTRVRGRRGQRRRQRVGPHLWGTKNGRGQKAAATEQRKGSPTFPSARLRTCGPVLPWAGHTRSTFNKRKRRPRLARRR